MMSHRHFSHWLLLTVATLVGATALYGCADDDDYTPEVRPATTDTTHPITFRIPADTETRGAVTTSLTGITEYGLAAVRTLGSEASLYINDTIKEIYSNTWGFARAAYFWPTDGSDLSFYAYTPADQMTASFANGALALHYAAPTKATEQQDLLLATLSKLERSTTSESVALTFDHICSAVYFAIDSTADPCTVTSVTLTQVAMTGDYVPTATPHWQAGSLDSDVTQNMSRLDGTATLPENATQSVRFTDQYMMLVPQTFGEEATVVVSYIIDGVHYTQSASLSGTTIAEGQKMCIMLKPTATSVTIQLNACYTIKQLNINIPTDCANWTVTSDDDNITLRSALTDYQEEGFWIKDEDCVTTLKGTQQGLVPIYLFTAENASTDTKSGNLLLTVYGEDKTKLYEEKIYYTQQGVESTGSYYIEPEFDTKLYPFGFANSGDWTGSVTFTSDDGTVKKLAELVLGSNATPPTGITVTTNSVTLDYSQCANYYVEYSVLNLSYTSLFYGYDCAQYIMSTETYIVNVSWGSWTFRKSTLAQGVALLQMLEIEHLMRHYPGGTINCPTNRAQYDAYLNCAHIVALKKNSFSTKSASVGGHTVQVLNIQQSDLTWYLPALYNVSNNSDSDYWLANTNDNSANSNALYTDGSFNTSNCSRTDTHLVRAVRSK